VTPSRSYPLRVTERPGRAARGDWYRRDDDRGVPGHRRRLEGWTISTHGISARDPSKTRKRRRSR